MSQADVYARPLAREYAVATFNRDKGRELLAMLAPAGFRLRPAYEIPGAVAPEESGTTLLENARIKARALTDQVGIPAIADDTGLSVDALDGAPGIFAARFAGQGATYADNIRLMLERLEGVVLARRTARFRTVCVACFPDGREVVGEGVLEGRIAMSSRGTNGFGYDPVFEVEGLGRTLAELSAAEKDRLSHRARAVAALLRRLA
jgi:XTP/dITP diphosphohydrolase